MLQILIIGRNAEILATVRRLVNSHEGWQGTAVQTDNAAIAALQKHSYDLALLTNGIDTDAEQELRLAFSAAQPGIIILQHYGGGSGLLDNEILEALDAQY